MISIVYCTIYVYIYIYIYIVYIYTYYVNVVYLLTSSCKPDVTLSFRSQRLALLVPVVNLCCFCIGYRCCSARYRLCS